MNLVLLLVLAAIFAFGLAWRGIANLRQAWALRHPLSPGECAPLQGQPVCLRGTVRVFRPLKTKFREAVLWYDWVVEEKRGKHWMETGRECGTAGFCLRDGNVEVSIAAEPTEVHGTTTITSYDKSHGALGVRWPGTERDRLRWLAEVEELTALGRLEKREGWLCLVRDPKLGLLLSPSKPERAALFELIKGWALLAGAVAIPVLGFWIADRLGILTPR